MRKPSRKPQKLPGGEWGGVCRWLPFFLLEGAGGDAGDPAGGGIAIVEAVVPARQAVGFGLIAGYGDAREFVPIFEVELDDDPVAGKDDPYAIFDTDDTVGALIGEGKG